MPSPSLSGQPIASIEEVPKRVGQSSESGNPGASPYPSPSESAYWSEFSGMSSNESDQPSPSVSTQPYLSRKESPGSSGQSSYGPIDISNSTSSNPSLSRSRGLGSARYAPAIQ